MEPLNYKYKFFNFANSQIKKLADEGREAKLKAIFSFSEFPEF
jgi:hypothetical protein